MKITNLNDTPKVKLDIEGAKNVLKQVPLSKLDGSPTFSFRVFTIGVDGNTPYHQHESEHMNYVITGEGAIVKENGQEIPISTGSFSLILPNEIHQYKNKSQKEDLIVICAVPIQYE